MVPRERESARVCFLVRRLLVTGVGYPAAGAARRAAHRGGAASTNPAHTMRVRSPPATTRPAEGADIAITPAWASRDRPVPAGPAPVRWVRVRHPDAEPRRPRMPCIRQSCTNNSSTIWREFTDRDAREDALAADLAGVLTQLGSDAPDGSRW